MLYQCSLESSQKSHVENIYISHYIIIDAELLQTNIASMGDLGVMMVWFIPIDGALALSSLLAHILTPPIVNIVNIVSFLIKKEFPNGAADVHGFI